MPHQPVSDLALITIGSQNSVPPPGHHFYLFHIATDRPDTPFCFEESIGGGHAAGGGAICLGLDELDGWPGDWRDHLHRAGCGWVAGLIGARKDDNIEALVAAILDRHWRK